MSNLRWLLPALVLTAACSASPAASPPTMTAVGSSVTPTVATPTPTPFDRTAHSTTDPTSPWVIVNKTHPLDPLDYRPDITLVRGYQVATPAAEPLTRLLDDADAAGVHLKIASAFRSLGYQQGVHSHLVATQGAAAADAVSARPGYSEHQTGLAVDLQPLDGSCALDPCFAGTDGGRWLAARAWRYGFVVRYTAANQAVTGYSPEPWHYRFVGRPLAAELRRTGTASLEEFFGVPGGDYARR